MASVGFPNSSAVVSCCYAVPLSVFILLGDGYSFFFGVYAFNLISWCWRLTRIQISLSIEMLSNLNLQIAFISSALIEV